MNVVDKKCYSLIPVYYGERGIATSGQVGTGKHYYYICYVSANEMIEDYRKADTILKLCQGCKKYMNFGKLRRGVE